MLGFPVLYLKAMRIMMFQLSGYYRILRLCFRASGLEGLGCTIRPRAQPNAVSAEGHHGDGCCGPRFDSFLTGVEFRAYGFGGFEIGLAGVL